MKTGELTGAGHRPTKVLWPLRKCWEPWDSSYHGGDRLAVLRYIKGCSEEEHTSNTLISKMTENAVMA